LPAMSCAMRDSLFSVRMALMRATARASGDAGAVAEPVVVAGSLRAGGGRDTSDGKAIAPD
jgi:hypothetical protein